MNESAVSQTIKPQFYIPRRDDTLSALRRIGPIHQTGSTIEQAEQVYQAWRDRRRQSGMAIATSKTRSRYVKEAKHKAKQFRAVDDGGRFSPRLFVDRLFEDSKRLAPATYARYRSAFLCVLELGMPLAKNSADRDEWILAFARLILQIKPPFRDQRAPADRPPRRAKFIAEDDFVTLIETLRKGRGNARKVADFAEITWATGLRPGEWAGVELFEPGSAAAASRGGDDEHGVLVVSTSKRKDGAVEYRHLRIDRELMPLLNDHLASFRAAQKRNLCGRKSDAVTDFIKRSTTRLAATCERLWPNDPRRRVTLASLRSQARANFANRFSKGQVAFMMGHATTTGDAYYAPRRRASAGLRMSVRCSPGLPVVPEAQSAPQPVQTPVSVVADGTLVLAPVRNLLIVNDDSLVDTQDLVDDDFSDEDLTEAPRP